jgi:PTH1 family peptidyl-tRNA hydrolase
LKSIEKSLGSQEYPRLKIGVGRRDEPNKSLVGHVLGKFSESEKDLLDLTLDRAVDQIESWIQSGLVEAMNRFNGPAPK